jgi:hypothetical protein
VWQGRYVCKFDFVSIYIEERGISGKTLAHNTFILEVVVHVIGIDDSLTHLTMWVVDF